MKVIRISKSGVDEATPTILETHGGRHFFAFTHGEQGRGRWQVRLPLGARDFPVEGISRKVEAASRAGAWAAHRVELSCGHKTSMPGRAEVGDTVRCPVCVQERKEALKGQEFCLVPLHRKDPKGNEMFLLGRGKADGTLLVLWSLDPGYRGGASWKAEGEVKVLALGKEAQGTAGYMGGADCPVLLMSGPVRLTWTRTGRLYDTPADWVAEYDGSEWKVCPVEECILEEAVFEF